MFQLFYLFICEFISLYKVLYLSLVFLVHEIRLIGAVFAVILFVIKRRSVYCFRFRDVGNTIVIFKKITELVTEFILSYHNAGVF